MSVFEDSLRAIQLLLLPSFTLGLGGTAVLIRVLNSAISDIIGSDFVSTTRAKGLREWTIVGKHVLKVVLLPVVTVMAIQLGHLLGGAVIAVAIFGWPGVGRLTLDAIGHRDYLIVQSTMFLFVTTFVLINILADVSYAFLDPRIRFSWASACLSVMLTHQ